MAALAFVVSPSWAQEGVKVSGRIYDATSKESLIQAVVMIQSEGQSDEAVLSDLDGFYSTTLKPGRYELAVSYVGYERLSKAIELTGPLELDFALETMVLREARVVADVAIERETPVAFSNIKPLQIQEELGSQPIPMILNSTPGVYASQEGSDDSGPSVTIRGFKQRNVSVMVDGIPVNPGAANSDIWRHVWAPFQPVFQVLVAPVFLTTDQACASSVAAAALPLERDGDGLPLYLAPYWVPTRGPRAAFEYVGYFVGSGAAFARVPSREREAFAALVARCRGLLGHDADT